MQIFLYNSACPAVFIKIFQVFIYLKSQKKITKFLVRNIIFAFILSFNRSCAFKNEFFNSSTSLIPE